MNEHFVLAYVNDKKRVFTLTARKRSSNLPKVTLQTKNFGYRAVVMAIRLEKHTADTMKEAIRLAYESAGYVYQTRPQLP